MPTNGDVDVKLSPAGNLVGNLVPHEWHNDEVALCILLVRVHIRASYCACNKDRSKAACIVGFRFHDGLFIGDSANGLLLRSLNPLSRPHPTPPHPTPPHPTPPHPSSSSSSAAAAAAAALPVATALLQRPRQQHYCSQLLALCAPRLVTSLSSTLHAHTTTTTQVGMVDVHWPPRHSIQMAGSSGGGQVVNVAEIQCAMAEVHINKA
ncbi:hypothetical protein TcWFU_008421 [Taenia crassiceps]|uniref:Uncharacterized protein n=1 Tax=Taenia crassiceps TaxID=6207 RepID=A0ABR4QSN3_9CEST